MRPLIALLLFLFPQVDGDNAAAVHEWGTFTSIAAEDGSPVSWRPLYAPSDLPCFVHRLDNGNTKIADFGTVRMETPVLYFYPLKPMTVSVHVAFPHGRVTEWYPQASGVQKSDSKDGWIEWQNVQLSKAGEPPATLIAASHYYAARNTDSWNLQSAGEREKLLFYRGIATFGVDLKPSLQSGGILLRNAGADTIPAAIVFENHTGKIGFRFIRGLREPVETKFSSLNGSLAGLLAEIEDELVEMGLYRKEARAMIATWRDSWFEEGLRVFYLLPRRKVDSLLPILIDPAPAQLARVFVGRVELLAPWMRAEIANALTSGDSAVLKKYGRFLDPFLDQMGNGNTQMMSARARHLLFESDPWILAESLHPPCGR